MLACVVDFFKNIMNSLFFSSTAISYHDVDKSNYTCILLLFQEVVMMMMMMIRVHNTKKGMMR